MSLGTFYFGKGMELLLTCKLFEIRTVWYYSQQHNNNGGGDESSEVAKMVKNEFKPDFVMVSFSQLPSLFSYSAKVDLDHFAKTASKDNLPSQTR
jgi:hypothetical protein